MMRLHWFNPENDMALAAGVANYTPTRAALAIRRAGTLLPLWYGANGDVVLSDTTDNQWLQRIQDDYGTGVTLWQPGLTDLSPCPWGWSAYAVRHMARHGIPLSAMPDETAIERMRELSHRRISVAVANRLASLMPDAPLTTAAVECRTVSDAERVCRMYQRVYAKMPWSSSGRGVICSADVSGDRFIKFCEDSVRRQGSVMIEPAHDKAIDFARLYECHEGKCREIGTSVFSTDSRGAYIGNLLMPEECRMDHVGQYIPVKTVLRVSECLRSILESEIAKYYSGIVGVDMLATRDGRLDAVVEVNLRMTMGYVANQFADRFMASDVVGVMSTVMLWGDNDVTDNYIARGGRLCSGSLAMSPPSGGIAFVATIQ